MTAPLSPTRLTLIRAAVALNPGNCEGAEADRAELLAEVDRLNATFPKPPLVVLTQTLAKLVDEALRLALATSSDQAVARRAQSIEQRAHAAVAELDVALRASA